MPLLPRPPQASASTSAQPLLAKITNLRWHRWLFSVRTRLLLWYLFLAGCVTGISVNAADRIYRESIVSRANLAMKQQLDQFDVFVKARQQSGKLSPFTSQTFDAFLNIYAPTRNEYFIMLIDGQLHDYRSYSGKTPAFLEQNPSQLADWAKAKYRQKGQIQLEEQRFQFVAQGFRLPGKQPGTLIVLYDVTSDFQQGRQALLHLLRDVSIFLGISLIFAWFTAGRVLAPLRQLTKTAQSIRESDMSQRLPVQGKDEIAELTTTFNEMLDRLQVAFESQKEFLKDASHELRTPITVIQGHLEMLQYRPNQQEETIVLVMDELDRMSRLVNDLLLLAKTENPNFLHLKTEELDWMTEELYLKARSLAPRQWKLESKGLSPIRCDRQRLTQAVMNLVQNAVRHTQENDTITLGSSVRDNYVALWVRDTGEGIAPQDQKRIFQRFTRGTNQDNQFEGYGLGLSIVQAIAHAHHGWVELQSHLGAGSTFTIIIPLEPPITPHESHPDRRGQSAHHFFPGNRTSG
ncbi:sensor histidine kinase [Leptolyngbya ohadii]|uniref:sensor histidine kinase n=1 Tax=Leptolyngbya ohadii TaxID=1962290 RepID=UPI000B5A14F9|nr:HAMP domain-containing sensor histidine kinase [Leptolyngbya ohadii]